ncbi:LysR family transcriptional regulator [Parasulfuritortus cantonensis]|uniref:LysR family transcriptional regulator n=1 Tax=Parasulfuritortus cantonensis TaxID=2528202 RepID=A0A4R1B8E6_9PROT|nr:LysR family transcriptional regulator [Parasulfuritortus cantonensis]TCJ12229.1 LysR family transcriptional regulator [Parasulfuritortus cantonensis]
MDIDQARTFLAIAATGSFVEAAQRLHLTQSTISARIQRLEEELGARLFVRNRAGAVMTTAGRRFDEYAKRLLVTAEQARHHVGLPSRYRATLRVGGRIALWESFLPAWVGWIRARDAEVAVRAGIGFEADLMRDLIEGTLDVGLMYTPSHSPGLVVEQMFDETLMLVSSRPGDGGPGDDYIYVQWGTAFEIQHTQSYPDLEPPPQVVNIGWLAIQLILSNGGSAYIPARMAKPMLAAGRLYAVAGAPRYALPAYAVYPKETDNPAVAQALEGLRELSRGVGT